MNHPILEDVDWVEKRANCSVGQLFEQLKQRVDDDVKARGRQIPSPTTDYPSLTFDSKARSFTVTLDGFKPYVHKSVVFNLAHPKILVSDEEGKHILEATASLGDDGRCLLKTNGDALEIWQFCRRALEDLFFTSGLP